MKEAQRRNAIERLKIEDEKMNKSLHTITYQLLFEGILQGIEMIEEQALCKSLQKLCKTLGVECVSLRIWEQDICLELAAERPYNLTKLSASLQSKLKISYPNLRTVPFIGITRSGKPSREDTRIRDLMASIDEIAYYDLDEVCDEEQAFKAYLGERPLTLIEQGKNIFLIDEEALKHPIFLNCFICTQTHQYGCCCGSPCDMSDKNKNVFKKHGKAIEEAMQALNPEDYRKVVAAGGFFKSDGSINAYDGRCAMLVADEGVYKCMPHKYARDKGLPIYNLCPLSCLMYPLEIIELIANFKTKAILLTAAVTDDFAKELSRWGSYEKIEAELRCLSKEAHNHQFEEANYKPVYEVNEGLLTHEFGKSIYKTLQTVLESKNIERR